MLSISSYFIEFEILPTDGYSSTIRKTLYPKISEQLKGKRPERSVFCHQSQTADDTPDRGVSLRMTVTATALCHLESFPPQASGPRAGPRP